MSDDLKRRRDLRNEIIKFVNIRSWSSPMAITLTLKQRISSIHGGVNLTLETCQKNLRHFLNLINRKLFGNASRRYGKSVSIFPILENGPYTRYHYHVLINRPDIVSLVEFKSLISSSWQDTDWGHHHIHFQDQPNEGWLWYLTKYDQKPEYDLAIDWMNFHKDDR